MEEYEDRDGQLSFLPISKNPDNMVVQANPLIQARQRLTLNEAKLIRIMIMQIINSDMEFNSYYMTPAEFANLLQVKEVKNIHREAESLCSSIISKPLEMKAQDGSWSKYAWVSKCNYNSKLNRFELKLNPDLKPFLLNLAEKGYYTQYELQYALSFNSCYGLRLFELLQARIMSKTVPKQGTYVELSLEEIKDACMLYNTDQKGNIVGEKYKNITNIKLKVLEAAIKDIQEKTLYDISYDEIKKGRQIVGFRFFIKMSYN